MTSSGRSGERGELRIFREEDMSFGRLRCSDGQRLFESSSGSTLTEGRWDSGCGEVTKMSGK